MHKGVGVQGVIPKKGPRFDRRQAAPTRACQKVKEKGGPTGHSIAQKPLYNRGNQVPRRCELVSFLVFVQCAGSINKRFMFMIKAMRWQSVITCESKELCEGAG
ncbi:hypothetical protein Salat_1370500 [Sesamum alatum]|uniref:Uncharacterized protein n=1 Tax=Sesamum alatum TaxID=300844 RepID=A0AAE2CKZ2_9LAMI|nr:hypothetical protein Salat_1370500 [Sesamum alatum]